jgi:hypothetical protein
LAPSRRAATNASQPASDAPPATRSITIASAGPNTTQSHEIPGEGSISPAVPNGSHRDATTAPPSPVRAPTTPAIAGAAVTVTIDWCGVKPSARMVRSSSVPAAAYRATAWPTRNNAAMNAAAAKATRHRDSKAMCRCSTRWPATRFMISMSERPVIRLMSSLSRGIADSPPRNRTIALM